MVLIKKKWVSIIGNGKECLGEKQGHVGKFLHAKKRVDHAKKKIHVTVQNSRDATIPMTTTPIKAAIVFPEV